MILCKSTFSVVELLRRNQIIVTLYWWRFLYRFLDLLYSTRVVVLMQPLDTKFAPWAIVAKNVYYVLSLDALWTADMACSQGITGKG